MPREMLRKPLSSQFPLPLLGRHVVVRDLTLERLRVLPRDAVHVLRPRTGEFHHAAEVWPRLDENRRNHASDIIRRHGRRLATAEWELDPVSLTDGRAGETEEEDVQEDGGAHGDDRQAGPREHLLAEPVLSLLMTRGGLLDAHLGDGQLGYVDQRVHPDLAGDRRHDGRRFEITLGDRHAEVDAPAALDGAVDVARLEQIPDHHVGAGGSQGRSAVVLLPDHGANPKSALEEEASYRAADGPSLTGGTRDQDRSNIGHPLSPLRNLPASR